MKTCMPQHMPLRLRLLDEASTFCMERNWSMARLSTVVVGDGGRLKRIVGGGDCTTGVFERFMSYIAAERLRMFGVSRGRVLPNDFHPQAMAALRSLQEGGSDV